MLELYRDLVRRHLDLLVSQPIARLFPAGGVYEPLHRSDVRADLERQAQERFAFLPNDHGFSLHLDPDPTGWGSWVDYRSKDIGVSIQFEYFEYYEHEMWVELVKLSNGQPPEGRALYWDHGVRVRAQVERVIGVYLKQDDPLIGEIRRMFSNTDMFERDKGFFTAVLDKHERLLKRHIEAILAAPLDVIFPHEPSRPGCQRSRLALKMRRQTSSAVDAGDALLPGGRQDHVNRVVHRDDAQQPALRRPRWAAPAGRRRR